MTTSGSIDFSLTRDNVIQDVLELCAVVPPGVTPAAADVTTCARTLNMMLKHWQTRHIHLFAVQKLYLFLQKNQHEYDISSSGDEFTSSFVTTNINGALSSGVSSIVVDSITGISNADRIGVEQDDGTLHWTTVNGSPSGSTITLTDVTTDAVNDDAVVYAYTTKANRFMKILEAHHHDKSSGHDVPINVVSRDQYWENSDKTSDGRTIEVYYDPQIGTGKLWVYPETDNVTDYLILHVQRTLEDMDAEGDTLDFPQEWYMPIVYNLAPLVAPKFQVPLQRIGFLRNIGERALMDAEDYSIDGTTVNFELDHG